MSTAIRQTWQVNLRYLRVLRRQPAYLGITLTQPIIWLLLFGALFKAVTRSRASRAAPISTSSRRAWSSCSPSPRPAGRA
jgi:hypothetical protein